MPLLQDLFRAVHAKVAAADSTSILVAVFVVVAVAVLVKLVLERPKGKPIPKVKPKSRIPFVGALVDFNKDPLNFLHNAYNQYGEVFQFDMLGRPCVYLIGSESVPVFFNSKNEELNAEDVYWNLVTPVFGRGVCYDSPDHKTFIEQKKMFKTGLTQERFRLVAPMIEEETNMYVDIHWKGAEGDVDLFEALSQLIIMTATRCLHGPEVRAEMTTGMADLFMDLDNGFTHLAWVLPYWLPLPSFRKRDAAHRAIKEQFYRIIERRRKSEPREDMLQTFLDSRYKNGRQLTDDEVAGMMIGLLMAGQHTSSTTSAWMGYFMAHRPDVQAAARKEADQATSPLELEAVKGMETIERVLKETLRLRPPIMSLMRMVREPQQYKEYVIPKGAYVCVSPPVNQRLEEVWGENPLEFNPDRFLDFDKSDKAQRFGYIPFGAGRHKCIGEEFAYVQIRTIWTALLRRFEFSYTGGQALPKTNFQTLIHTPAVPRLVHYRRRSGTAAVNGAS